MSLLMDAPPLLGVLDSLEALSFDDMTVDCASAVVRAVAVVRGRGDVVEAKSLASFARGNGAQVEGATDTTSWLAAKTKTSGRTAKRRVKRARVIEVVPAFGDALAAGEISAAHVDAVAAIVPAKLLPKAGSLVAAAKASTPEELAQAAQQLVIDSDGDGGAKRALRLEASQQVRFFDLDSGMRAMFGEWDPEIAGPIERAVDLVANELWQLEHPTRTPTLLDESSPRLRRAQAVSEIARRIIVRADADIAATAAAADAAAADAAAKTDTVAGAVDEVAEVVAAKPPIASKCVTAKSPRARQMVAALSVLIDYQTIRGELAINGIRTLFDGTPISPDTVRRLACDAGIIPMVMGSRGEVLDQGRGTYAPTVAQRHAVAIRDRHCAFPGCRRPAKGTDVHHIVAFKPGAAAGGNTDLDNLLLLCEKHHHMVHEAHWRLAATAFDFYRPDGTLFDHVTRGPP